MNKLDIPIQGRTGNFGMILAASGADRSLLLHMCYSFRKAEGE